MNLREIKKDITYILGAFIEDCATAVQNPKVNEKTVSDLMNEALDLYDELREKIMVKNVEGSKKSYFNALRKEILERTDALYTKLSEAVTKQDGEAAGEPAPVKKAAPKKLGTAAVGKPAEEKPAAEKPAPKKAPAKKAEKPEEEKPAAEKPAPKKAPAKKAPAKKAEEGAEEKPAPKKAPAKKAPAKKAEEPKAE